MRTLAFFSLLICFSGCQSKEDIKDTKVQFELLADDQQPVGTDHATEGHSLALLDVKSYNARTGEIQFSNKLSEDISQWKERVYKVKVYGAQQQFFTLTFSTSLFSYLYNEPVLYYSLMDRHDGKSATIAKNKWYILSGYPYGKVLGNKNLDNPEQLKSFENIAHNWNLFIEELKKAGKYKK